MGAWLPINSGAPIASVRNAIVLEALDHVGLLEIPIGSNRSPFIDSMMEAVGSPKGESWCAAFMTLCFKRNGAQVPTEAAGACDTWRTWGIANKTFRYYTQESDPPAVGDGVLFSFTGDGRADHCGIVARTSPALLTIEGNTTTVPNDKEGVGVFCKYRPTLAGILGFITPTTR
jgi:hypothetical protein